MTPLRFLGIVYGLMGLSMVLGSIFAAFVEDRLEAHAERAHAGPRGARRA